jgi:hypothetical protein
MDFKEKKKISHFWDNFSRAAFFIPENLSKEYIQSGLSAGSKSRSKYNNLALLERSKSKGDPMGSVTKIINLTI